MEKTMASRIYLDHSATTPLDPQVFQAMEPYLHGIFGNPSSSHKEGREARKAVDKARTQVAALLNADPSEIVFTASGTEADNLALVGAMRAHGGPGHVITSIIEHPAVLETCRFLERLGTEVTYLPVDNMGVVDITSLSAALRPDTRLVSVMAANNVVGTLQPLAQLGHITKENGTLFHTDAVQAAGKIALDVRSLPVDLISLSAHKLHGPKGIGALFVRRGTRLDPLVFGGGQERGLRSATENVAGIVGFGAAAALAQQEIAREAERLAALRKQILKDVRETVPQACLIGHPVARLPGHLSLGFRPECNVSKLLHALDEAGVAVSSGSACSTHHTGAPTDVLEAMGLDPRIVGALVRVTLGRFTTQEEVARFTEILPQAVTSVTMRADFATAN